MLYAFAQARRATERSNTLFVDACTLVSLLLPWRFNINRLKLPGPEGVSAVATLAPGGSFGPPARKHIPRQAPFPATQ